MGGWRRWPGLVALVALAEGSAACQLISGVDDLTVSNAPATPDAASDGTDAGADATTEAAVDGGAEGSTGPDASGDVTVDTNADASTDAATTGMDAPSDASTDAMTEAGYCQGLSPSPLFCADFDEGQDASSYWSSTAGLMGSVNLTGQYAKSPPDSTLCQTTSDTGFAYGEADLSEGNPGTYTFTFDFLIVSGDTASIADMYVGEVDFPPWSIDVELQATGNQGQYSVDLWETLYSADAGYSVVTHNATGLIKKGTWSHVALVLSTPDGGANGTGSLTVDGMLTTFSTGLVVGSAPPFAQAGIVSNEAISATAGWVIAVDDVTFDWH